MKAAIKALVFRFPFTTGVLLGIASWMLGIACVYPLAEYWP